MASHSQGSRSIVDRVWNYCNVLRTGGISCGDHLEQLKHG